MNSLFEKDARYSKEAHELNERTEKILAGLYHEYMCRGFSPRDIALVIANANTGISCDKVLAVRDPEL